MRVPRVAREKHRWRYLQISRHTQFCIGSFFFGFPTLQWNSVQFCSVLQSVQLLQRVAECCSLDKLVVGPYFLSKSFENAKHQGPAFVVFGKSRKVFIIKNIS